MQTRGAIMANMDFDQGDQIDQGAEVPDLDEGAHLDAFRVADDDEFSQDADFVPVDDEGAPVEIDQGPRVMSLEAWEATWELAWNVPGMVMPKYAPLGITPEKKPASSAAARAVFEIAEEHFPWLIEERGGVLGAVLAIGPFAAMQYGAFREIQAAEIQARQEAANTNAPPMFQSTRAEPPEAANTDAPPSGAGLDWMDQEQAA